jgi:hypothetical protein
MREFAHLKVIGLAASMMMVMAAMFWMYRNGNTPEPTRHTYLLEADGVARAMVTPKRAGIRSRRNPSHLEYQSAAGAVNVYVVRYAGSRAQEREQFEKLADEFAAGQFPKDFVAKSSGDRGRINLGGRWKRHHEAYYMVLIRSANESEVKLVVHYAP